MWGNSVIYVPQLVLTQRAQADHSTENITGKGRAGDLPSPYPAGTHERRTDASALAGVKWVARGNAAQTLNEELQLPAGPRFLLPLMQTEHVVNHHLKKTNPVWQASSQLGQADPSFPSLKQNLQWKQRFWTESPVAALFGPCGGEAVSCEFPNC